MNPISISILYAFISAALLQASTYFIQLTQLKFRNIMGKQLRNSPFFTIMRMLSYGSFYGFLFSIILGLVSAFLMINFSVINDGFILIIPFIIFFITLVGFSILIDSILKKKLKGISNGKFGISIKPIVSFSDDSKEFGEINYHEDEICKIKDMFDEIHSQLNLNLVNSYGKCKGHFATPGPKYPAAYLWDSAFISGVWRLWDVEIAKQIMMPFLDNQLDNGQCPQTISLGLIINSKITNPPLIAWSLVEIARMSGDYSFFRLIYPKLKKFNEFLYRERCNKNGLFVWKHSYESGIDNSPRFTDTSEKIKVNINEIWAVDFNTWMVLHNDRMAEIADKLGFNSDASEFSEKRDKLITLINETLWDSNSGLYFDFNFEKKELIKIPTIFSLFPMFAKVPTIDQAKQLVENIKNPDLFNTLIPFPTVARNEKSFMKDCWRGSVWINTSYVVIKALQFYGENELAAEMAYRIVKGVANTFHNEGSIFEFYDPDNYTLTELSRKKGNFYKQITLGGKPVKNFVGWTGLANTLLIEDVIGYKRVNGKTSFCPHFPSEFKNIKITIEINQFLERLEIYMDEKDVVTGALYYLDNNGNIVNKFDINIKNHEKFNFRNI